jgi:hypothetical protein
VRELLDTNLAPLKSAASDLSAGLPPSRGAIRPRAGYYTRRITNVVMLTLTGLATLLAVIPLVL